jgi:hypothetical protein
MPYAIRKLTFFLKLGHRQMNVTSFDELQFTCKAQLKCMKNEIMHANHNYRAQDEPLTK